jgi:outer membrane protein assembly factor BamB
MALKPACAWLLVAILSPLALAQEDYIPGEALREAELIKAWQLSLQLDKTQHLTDAYLLDDQLYLATDDGYVFAVHAETGAIRWLRRVSSEGFRIRRPCHVGERVIFITPTTVLQLNRLSGEGESKTLLKFPAGSAPVTDGERVFVGGLDRRLHAFEAAEPVLGWRVIVNDPITSAPVVLKDHAGINVVVAASDDGTVYACTATKKAFRWQASVWGSITADLAAGEEGIYVPCRDQSLYLLDPLFGEVRWRARFSGPLYEPPVVTADTAYQFCPDDGLVSVNTAVVGAVERLRWKLPRGRVLLAADARYAYVLSQDQSVLVVGHDDGTVAYTLSAPGMTLAAPSPAHAALYVASTDGRVFSARPRGTPLVTSGALRDAVSPPETAAEAAEKLQPASQPSAKADQTDSLSTSRKGRPIGGKSKVSKGYTEGATEPTTKPSNPPQK